MILFKPEHVAPILEGRKTQTRRLGKKRWNVGAVHQASTRLFDPAAVFARLKILDVRQEWLADVSLEDAQAEGYETRTDFINVFAHINRLYISPQEILTWVVKFEVAA